MNHINPDAVAADTPAPPMNQEAEQALLGAILVNNAAYQKVSEFLEAEHFAIEVHGRIFAAAARLIERGQVANPTTLKGFFDNDEALTDLGGSQYLADLARAAVTIINAGHYGRLIHDLYLRRQLIALGEDMVNDAREADINALAGDDGATAAGQIETAEQRLFRLASAGQLEGGFQALGTALTSAIRQAEAAHKRDSQLAGVPTGFRDLDGLLGGLHRSDLVILAGRPAMGKTALATNMGFNAARAHADSDGADGGVIAFFSLEMSSEQLATRILSENTEIPSDRIRRGDVGAQDFDTLLEASRDLERIPLYIDDTPALSIAAVRTRARRLAMQQGLDVVIVDYLQLLRGTGLQGQDNRVQELSEITRGLKALAKELNVPVIALSQLSRQVEQREDKRPQLADLRESGTIEQDADVVMFVYREQYYLERAEPSRRADETDEKFNDRYDRWARRFSEAANKAEVIIAKQRHGPIGTVKLYFDGSFTRFGDLIEEDRVPDVAG